MKEGRCPKCERQRIATSKVTLYEGRGQAGPTLRIYACAHCRFVETYLHDDPAKRVEVLDTWTWVTPDDGPFR
jgi:hypothetical protein